MSSTNRRSFLKTAFATVPCVVAARLASFAEDSAAREKGGKAQFVAWGEDRLGTPHKGPRAGSHLLFKVSTADTAGGLFLLEHSNMQPGGPHRHLHYNQEEWFYLIEGGEVVMEIGEQRLRLKPGDCVLAPRNVPHAWAYIGDKPGRMLLAFTPAGKMEAFFTATSKPGAHAGNAKLMREHDMELVGPPLSLEDLKR